MSAGGQEDFGRGPGPRTPVLIMARAICWGKGGLAAAV